MQTPDSELIFEVSHNVPVAKKWDNRIEDYDNYIEEYVTHYKKSLQGNSASASKYPYMKIRWEALGAKLEKAKIKKLLSEDQLQRINKIQMKILNACCE